MTRRLDRCGKLEQESLARTLQNRRLLNLTPAAAEYAIDTEGKVVHVNVLLARMPAIAWSAIRAVARADVNANALRALDPGDFPLQQCVLFRNGLRLHRNWIRIEADTKGGQR